MNKSILVFLIDDDPDDQLFFELAIADMEHDIECVFADDAIKGIAMLKNPEFNPDFIFIDMNMPKVNGLECLAEIRKIQRLDQVPVFMYSTTDSQFIMEKCKSMGGDGLIKKQITVAAIREKLLSVFTSKLASTNE